MRLFSYRERGALLALMALSVLATSAVAQDGKDTNVPDDATAGFLVEHLDTTVRFAADGTGTRERTAQIRLQSDAAVRALGVLSFSFASDNEHFEVGYVRVRKPDGRVIETPPASFQEAPSPVATAAPMYSDLRVIQIPVRALASGDLLEYQLRWTGTKPLIPNQFWFELDFEKSVEVKAETLTIRVPSAKYVKLSSPEGDPTIREEGGEKVYSWTTSHAIDAQKAKDEKTRVKKNDAEQRHSVELTTFRNWDEIGRWYESLAAGKAAVTPEVQAKADELTKGLTSVEAKERAIYDYVSTKYRYISISFGEGRYQPHSASEVMANLYGDCKDKHTLLTALMKAAGVDVSTVLIGVELPFNPDVPSPAQFNHVIGMIPGEKEVWLDTTSEVAPFGQILKPLRAHQALLIPPSGPSKVVSTPKEPIIPNAETIRFKGSLDGQGTMTGHLDLTLGGDEEVLMRSLFHSVPPSKWTDFAQSFAANLGYAGKVSAVDVDPPQDTSKRFHFGWDYVREKYGDWDNLRIPAPVPESLMPEAPADTTEPLDIEAIDSHFEGEVKLPEGYSIEIPPAARISNSAGDFEETYQVANGVLQWRKVLNIRKDKIEAADRKDYASLQSLANENAGRMLTLAKTGGSGVQVSETNPRAEELIRQAGTALQNRQMSQAQDALKQAELLNPKQPGLWMAWAAFYGISGQNPKAQDSLRKEIEIHPTEPTAYRMLAQFEISQNQRGEAEGVLRKYLTLVPEDTQIIGQLASLLSADKEYAEAIELLDRGLKLKPDDVGFATTRITALIQSGRKQDGVEAAKQIREKIQNDGSALNNVGYELIDTGADKALGREMIEKSVGILEDGLKDVQLSSLDSDRLMQMNSLGNTWDSAGWANFLNGDFPKAARQVEAAWKLQENPIEADHLGQIYEKLGRKQDAIHMYHLAIADRRPPEGVEDRLHALEGPTPPPIVIKSKTMSKVVPPPVVSPSEELGKIRTVGVPEFTRKTGAAEFFVLLSSKGPEDVLFISGADDFRGAKDAILHAKFDTPFADDGPEKIARRGVLSCSGYTTPNCQLVLLLPSNTTAP